MVAVANPRNADAGQNEIFVNRFCTHTKTYSKDKNCRQHIYISWEVKMYPPSNLFDTQNMAK